MKRILFLLTIVIPLTGILSAQENRVLQMRADPAYFSPDGNGYQDHTFFYPVLNTDEILTRWQLDIMNEKGKRVMRYSGAGMMAFIKWDGTDKKGQAVLDGTYQATIEGWSKKNHLKSEPVSVTVDRVPPQVSLQVSTPVLDQAIDGRAEISFFPTVIESSPLDRWQLQVLDAQGHTVFVDWSTGPLHSTVWNARDVHTGVFVPEGDYVCILDAWDVAGNESLPANVKFAIKMTPSEILKNALKNIVVFETPVGLITQLQGADLFAKTKTDISFSPQGESLLKETALLVNAYPNIPIRVEGYYSGKQKGDKNRDASSLYAWKVYSFLVKQGNVKPSRLTVHGRGRSPLFDRRSMEPAPLKDGVEVTLEGHQKW